MRLETLSEAKEYIAGVNENEPRRENNSAVRKNAGLRKRLYLF